MAKFVGSLMRDYLLFAISLTLLAPSGHLAAREGAPVAIGGFLLPLLANRRAAERLAVRLPPIASRAEGNYPVTLGISALNDPR